MLRKPKPDSYVEPMPRRQFHELMREFKRHGGTYIANAESEQFLRLRGAEACALNENIILFRRKPSRSAVYEELFHVQQFRENKIDGSPVNTCECEIEAQQYLLENAVSLQLTKIELEQTRNALMRYTMQLKKMKGEASDDHL